MIYLIGGTSRAGKSTFARTLRRETGAQAIAGDAFRSMLRSRLSERAQPNLHWRNIHGLDAPTAYIDYFVEHTPQAIENMRQEARDIWQFYQDYINAYGAESDDDLVIESVDILPECVAQLSESVQVQSYFFIDTSPAQSERILEYLEQERHGWLQSKRLTREQIKQWALFNARRSEYIKKQAELYHLAYFDVAELGYNGAQERAYASWQNVARP